MSPRRRARLARAACALLAAFVGARAVAAEPLTAGPPQPLAARLHAAIERHVLERAERAPAEIVVPDLERFAAEVPGSAAVAIEVRSDPAARLAGSVPLTLVLSSAGRELRRGVVTARIRVDGRMLVVARPLPKGSLVGPDDVREKACDVTAIPAGAPASADALVGRRTVRALAEGLPWRIDLVEDPPLVVRGQRVQLRLVAGALRLDARGKAKDDGRRGDVVRVLNEDSRREVVGRVAADGAVDVQI